MIIYIYHNSDFIIHKSVDVNILLFSDIILYENRVNII